jgi:hypothetical protein
MSYKKYINAYITYIQALKLLQLKRHEQDFIGQPYFKISWT